MKDKAASFKTAAVFIGTVVGAGLASGQEVLQFFTLYGFYGIIGIVICGLLYILTGVITVDLSYKHKATSYNDLIYLSCGELLGSVVDVLTTLFLFGSTVIILAGSGSLFLESLGIPKIVGIIVMAVLTLSAVLYSTKGLIFINSIIVPCMITVIAIISVNVFLNKSISLPPVGYKIINAPVYKEKWFLSTLLYMSFNMLSATGVLSPMTRDINSPKAMVNGTILGAVGLFFLTGIMDIILLLNEPVIFNYSIPMLYIASTISTGIKIALSVVMWLEMFSTAVSDTYSLAKKINHSFNIGYKKSAIMILILAFPFTWLGFKRLITFLYPIYGAVSLIYMFCLIFFYFEENRKRI